MGDFFESWMKWWVGVKDFGWLLFGYGGLFDWFDGLFVVFVVGGVIFVLFVVLKYL